MKNLFNKIQIFSTACKEAFCLKASSKSIPAFAYISFNTEEIIIAILTGSSNENGFKPAESGLFGSIKFTF